MDAKNLKKEFGKDIIFLGGGIDMQNILPFGSTQDVAYEVRRNILDLSNGGGFIFTHPQNIQKDVHFINFKTMIDTFNKNMQY